MKNDELIRFFEPHIDALQNQYGHDNVEATLFDFGYAYLVSVKKNGIRIGNVLQNSLGEVSYLSVKDILKFYDEVFANCPAGRDDQKH